MTSLTQSTPYIGRLAREPRVQAIAAITAAPAIAAGLQAVGVSTDLDIPGLTRGLLDAQFWLMLSTVAGFGALGGVAAELLSLDGNIELPHRVRRARGNRRTRLAEPRHMLDLGVFSRLLLGAAAALAVLALYAPTSPTALVVTALIAGSTATGVFRIAHARLLGAGQEPPRRERKMTALPPRKDEAA
jgi:hypothetical protein